jgi:hypothetical protein
LGLDGAYVRPFDILERQDNGRAYGHTFKEMRENTDHSCVEPFSGHTKLLCVLGAGASAKVATEPAAPIGAHVQVASAAKARWGIPAGKLQPTLIC